MPAVLQVQGLKKIFWQGAEAYGQKRGIPVYDSLEKLIDEQEDIVAELNKSLMLAPRETLNDLQAYEVVKERPLEGRLYSTYHETYHPVSGEAVVSSEV